LFFEPRSRGAVVTNSELGAAVFAGKLSAQVTASLVEGSIGTTQ
jgi:hypothetical protein